MNESILRDPECIRLLQGWWDETQDFSRGTTSAVLADWLEDHGWEGQDRLDVMRGAEGRMLLNPLDLCDAAGVYPVSIGTSVCPWFRRCLFSLWEQLRTVMNRDPGTVRTSVLLGPSAASAVGYSREVRDHLAYAVHLRDYIPLDPPLSRLGCPSSMYGWKLILNPYQPIGHVDTICGEHIVTARVN